MPELPEVERAATLIRSLGTGKRIQKVETTEDTIVFSGVSHEEFANEITGRILKSAGRYGKVFYLELDGTGRVPVLHFGMTGMLQVRGELATYYRETPNKASTDWPPRFMKFILHLCDEESNSVVQLAFLDARRLGRIRLCGSPLTEPPISTLGFDPILSMPSLEDFKALVLKRTCPIKALLLDQTFSAGVGNWVADEILHHARIHPEQRCNTFTDSQLVPLHHQTGEVCRVAVEVNADDSKFPANWLFKHRWGKGKKSKHTMTLPSGKPATLKWVTVGGRTSAYVAELQTLNKEKGDPSGSQDGDESDLTPLSDEDEDVVPARVGQKRKAPVKRANTRRTSSKLSSTSYGRKINEGL